MTYAETIGYLYSTLPVFHRIGKAAYKANLDNSLFLDEHFGSPHKKYKCVHVAGTNGKGSVSHMTAAILQSAGYKTALFTSPHLTDFRERIRINGEMIPEQYVIAFVANHRSIIEKIKPSFFEITSTMAFDYFAKQGVDVAVIETGMGGRLDSTNIIAPVISVITNISFDHTDFLGNTLKDIGTEKAGIIKEQTPILIGEYDKETADVFYQKASEKNAEIYFANQCLSIKTSKIGEQYQTFEIQAEDSNFSNLDNLKVEIDLMGNYQSKNILTVLAATEILKKTGFDISYKAIIGGLAKAAAITGLRGRWQIIGKSPLIVCDTGHNAHGLTYVINQIRNTKHSKLYIVFGVVNDKDLDSVLPLLPREAYYFFTKADIPRAMDAHELAEKATASELNGEVITNVKDALSKAKSMASVDDLIFVGGSTFVVAEVL